MIKKRKVFFFLILFFSFFIANFAHAFSISPTKFFITLNPGESQVAVVNIKNDNGEKIFGIEVVGMKQDEGGRSVFIKNIDEAENWIKMEDKKKIIKSGQEEKIRFSITAPKDALPGAHYIGLLVGPVNGNGEGIGIEGKLAAIVKLQVAGEVQEVVDAKIDLSNYKFYQKDWNFLLDINNKSNIDIPVKISSAILDWKNNIVTEKVENDINSIISKSKRILPLIFTGGNNLPGLYKLQVKIDYGRTHQTITLIKNFWYLPIWIIISISIIILVVVYIIFRKNKKYVLPKK